MKIVYPLVTFWCFTASLAWALDRASPPSALGAAPFAKEAAMVDAADPSNPREAEDFLSRILPLAVAANPKYRSGDSADLTEWLTKSIRFSRNATPRGLTVAMSEQAIVFRNGVQVEVNAHDAAFAIEDVDIFEYSYPSDATETGEKAVGVMLRCRSGACIRSRWNGSESAKDDTDFYLYDAVLRGRILRAFAILKKAT